MASGGEVTLMSSDGEEFTVPVEVANRSITIANTIEEAGTDDAIPLPNVSSAILSKVIEYCQYHVEAEAPDATGRPARPEDVRRAWDDSFVRVEQHVLFELILAANYLDVKPLLDLLCLTVANMIRGKTPEEIRAKFNIENDFSPAEEEEIRRENQWAFE